MCVLLCCFFGYIKIGSNDKQSWEKSLDNKASLKYVSEHYERKNHSTS